MLNLEQAAEYMGLAVGEFLELLDGGIGPAHYKIGKVYRFKQADLDRFMEAHRVEESSQNLRTAIGMLATPLDSLREPATEQVEAPPPGPRPTVVLPGDPQPEIRLEPNRPYVRPVSTEYPDPTRGMTPKQLGGCGIP